MMDLFFRSELVQKTIMARKQANELLSYSYDSRKAEQHGERRTIVELVQRNHLISTITSYFLYFWEANRYESQCPQGKQTNALHSDSYDKRNTEQHSDKENNDGVVKNESSHLYHCFTMAVFRSESMQKTIMAQKQTEALLSYSSDKRKTEQHCDKRNNLGVVAKESSHLYHYFMMDILLEKQNWSKRQSSQEKQTNPLLSYSYDNSKTEQHGEKEQRWNCQKGIISSLPLYIFGKQTDPKDNHGKEKIHCFLLLMPT